MKKGSPFAVKVIFEEKEIINNNFKNITDIDDTIKILKKKFK